MLNLFLMDNRTVHYYLNSEAMSEFHTLFLEANYRLATCNDKARWQFNFQ